MGWVTGSNCLKHERWKAECNLQFHDKKFCLLNHIRYMKIPLLLVLTGGVLLIVSLPGQTHAAPAPADTDSMSALLQQGLFEEEANNNLEAAMQAYRTVVNQFDHDRRLAATAIYRLGECHRKQGKTNEAAAHYNRIVREFPDIGPVATLSTQNLAALGTTITSPTVEPNTQPGPAMVTSAEEGEIMRIRVLIQNSPDLINAATSGGTPLHIAANAGHLTVARFLLENGALVDARRAGRETPLHLAAAGGHNAIAELLIKYKADVGARDSGGLTPLHHAAGKGFAAIGRTLLDAGADPNAGDNNGLTPLHKVAEDGHSAFATLLLDNKARVNARSKGGDSPLHLACAGRHVEMAGMLVSRGADVNARDEVGCTPLMRAVLSDHVESAQMLLRHKADPNTPRTDTNNLDSPLHPAILFANTALLQLLLENGADPNVPQKRGVTVKSPLELVFEKQNTNAIPELVAILLKHKADPNPPTQGRNSPLMASVAGGHEKAALRLLQAGANVNATNSYGATSLHLSLGQPSICKVILDGGANIHATTVTGLTPLHYAVMSGLVPQMQELVRRGAAINARDKWGLTPLHYAVMLSSAPARQREVVAALLAAEADPNARDDTGYTPLAFTKGMSPYTWTTYSAAPGVDAVDNVTPSPFRRAGSGNGPPLVPGIASAQQSEIADLLRKHGALDVLPNPNGISVSRAGNGPQVILEKGTNDWNQFTLIEVLGVAYGFLSNTPESAANTMQRLDLITSGTAWPFPDLSNIQIQRLTTAQEGWKTIKVDLADILDSGDCSKDVPLRWGDMVIIPETEHRLGDPWQGFRFKTHYALNKCWARVVRIIVKGQRHDLTLCSQYDPASQADQTRLGPGGVNVSVPQTMWIEAVLTRSGLLLSTSDLSTVKVTRTDPATMNKSVFVLDCSPNKPPPPFWLRHGDVIEVPDAG